MMPTLHPLAIKLLLPCILLSTQAFSLTGHRAPAGVGSRNAGLEYRMQAMAEPADAPAEADEEALLAKEALKAELDGPANSPDRAVVGEFLLALEAANPTPAPATSELLNGRWKVLYATGASPGLKALQLLLKGSKAAPKSPSGAEVVDVEDSYLTIGADQPRATSSVKVRVLSFENTLSLKSQLEAESAVRLVETYDAASSEAGSLSLPFANSPAKYKRSLLVSYLDEEMMVVRDVFGRPDVLLRDRSHEEEVVAAAEESEPGVVAEVMAEDDAPGAS